MPGKEEINTPEEGQEMLVVSEIWEEMQRMKPQMVRLEQVYLDPNNPRLEVLKRVPVPDEKLIEPRSQQRCLEQLENFGLKDLRDSISTSGFCTIDRVVLRRLDEDKYIVVEGNRRVAALQVLLEDHSKGRIELGESILPGILQFEALVYEGDNPDIAWVIQGFRHAPQAIKEWEDFSKAKFFAELERKGKKPSEIAKAFSVRPRADVANLIRSYYGFQQAKEDEDYGERLKPSDHFGFFSQVIFPKLELRDKWLNWDDNERRFGNTENLNKFLCWIADGKITISTDTRDALPKLLFEPAYADISDRFEQEKGTNIQQCSVWIKVREFKPSPLLDIPGILDSLGRIKNEIDLLLLTPISGLGKTSEEKEQKSQILTLLNEIVEAVKRQIRMLSAE